MSLVVLDAGMVNVALPSMAHSLEATPASVVLVITAYQTALVMALLASPGLASATGCFPVASAPSPLLHLAGLRPPATQAAIPAGATVQLTFLGHASFLIETARGVTAVTDYNAYVRAPVTPVIVTMNNAHDSHFTVFVDPAV